MKKLVLHSAVKHFKSIFYNKANLTEILFTEVFQNCLVAICKVNGVY